MTDPKKKSSTDGQRSSCFPRTTELPQQSPKYWAKEKDRYIRQQLIEDIQDLTNRKLVVYYSQLSEEIGHTDPDDLAEILSGLDGQSFDLFIQTPGGSVDATEKLISVLRHTCEDYRVIVPSWAKSAGTVVALSGQKIVLGLNSELGPIDPQFRTNSGNVPCEYIAKDPAIAQHIRDMASASMSRMRALAEELLTNGMMKGREKKDIDDTLGKISSSNGYNSHGAVIDNEEATALGLSIQYLEPSDETWRRIWLLYCLYDYDTKQNGLGKVFEGVKFSISRPLST